MDRLQRGGALTWFAGFLVFVVLAFGAYVWFVLKWSYSSGERAGWVQKLSHKGWFCKTWEGELAMIAVPGALPEKFFFTVWDDDVAERINKLVGQRVSLHYEEKVGIPTDCFGESRYIVTKVMLIETPAGGQAPLASPSAAQPAGGAPAPGAGAPAQAQPPSPDGASPPAATPQPAPSQAGGDTPAKPEAGASAPAIAQPAAGPDAGSKPGATADPAPVRADPPKQ